MQNIKRYAAIDIGSNSVRFQIEGEDKKHSVTTRLGSGLADTGLIAKENAIKSAVAAADFVKEARACGCTPIAYATSAVRDAKNREEFLALIKNTCGIDVDVLSGEREAQYAYLAASENGGGLIDIGGASMQLASKDFKKSFPLGCVRGKDIALKATGCRDCDDDFPRQKKALGEHLDKLVSPYLKQLEGAVFSPCIGVGGSITTLCALKNGPLSSDKFAAHGVTLGFDELEKLISELSALKNVRAALPLLRVRHDVILYGAAILSCAMEILHLREIKASLRDGLDGYLEAAARGELQK